MKSFNFSQVKTSFSQLGRLIKTIIIIFVLFIVAILVAGAFLAFNPNTLATVNGEAITQSQVIKRMSFVRATAELQGIPEETFNDTEIFQSQVLDQMIIEEVVLGKIEEANGDNKDLVSKEQLDNVLEVFRSDENVQDVFNKYGVSEEYLTDVIEDQLAIETYLQGQISLDPVDISQDDIDSYYQTLKVQYGDTFPAQEEIQAQLQADLQNQQMQERARVYIQDLKNQADIQLYSE